MRVPPPGVGNVGVGGISKPSRIGTIVLTITDCKGASYDRYDNCGVLTRRTYSICIRERDEFQKLVCHPVQYRVPMLQANEGDGGAYQRSYDKQKTCLHDQTCLLGTMTNHTHPYWGINRRRLHPDLKISNNNVHQESDDSEMAQQPNFDTSYPDGLTVKWQTIKN
eukprot:15343181-Ditylum_brightwellii.AAC.1